MNLQQGVHVLHEVQLLVAGSGPEVGPLDDQALARRFARGVDEGEAGLASEGWIGQHYVEVDARMRAQAVVDDDVGLVAADAVEIEVHHG